MVDLIEFLEDAVGKVGITASHGRQELVTLKNGIVVPEGKSYCLNGFFREALTLFRQPPSTTNPAEEEITSLKEELRLARLNLEKRAWTAKQTMGETSAAVLLEDALEKGLVLRVHNPTDRMVALKNGINVPPEPTGGRPSGYQLPESSFRESVENSVAMNSLKEELRLARWSLECKNRELSQLGEEKRAWTANTDAQEWRARYDELVRLAGVAFFEGVKEKEGGV